MLLQGEVLTSFFMLEAPGWGELIPPVSSPLATLRLSSLCLSTMACWDAASRVRLMVLAEHAGLGPGYWHMVWLGDRLQ